MGNCSVTRAHCARRSKVRSNRLEALNTEEPGHEGIRTIVMEKHCEFPSGAAVCMCILTWNMNGKVSSEDLMKLVGGDRNFDLFVVGMQEVPKENICHLLEAALADTHRLVGEAIMQSLQLFVFGPKNWTSFTKEIRVDQFAVGGLGGLIGRKKGAVAMSLNFKGVHILLINCHLSAHARNVEERNFQFQQISQHLERNRNRYARPYHVTIWLGDLNYRVQELKTQPARTLIQRGQHRLLTSRDQLLQEAHRGQVFNGYCEGILAFKPTYKYNVGSSDYDTSYKDRVPSWTDRILYKIDDIDAVLDSYESIDCIYASDHKPVKAHICLKLSQASNSFFLKN